MTTRDGCRCVTHTGISARSTVPAPGEVELELRRARRPGRRVPAGPIRGPDRPRRRRRRRPPRRRAVGARDAHRGLAGVGVLDDVGERLGDHEVGRRLDRLRQPLRRDLDSSTGIGERPPAPRAPPEAAVGQDGRVDAARELAQLLERERELLLGAVEQLARPLGVLCSCPGRAAASATSATSRCWAPSCRLRSSRRRSACRPRRSGRARRAAPRRARAARPAGARSHGQRGRGGDRRPARAPRTARGRGRSRRRGGPRARRASTRGGRRRREARPGGRRVDPAPLSSSQKASSSERSPSASASRSRRPPVPGAAPSATAGPTRRRRG